MSIVFRVYGNDLSFGMSGNAHFGGNVFGSDPKHRLECVHGNAFRVHLGNAQSCALGDIHLVHGRGMRFCVLGDAHCGGRVFLSCNKDHVQRGGGSISGISCVWKRFKSRDEWGCAASGKRCPLGSQSLSAMRAKECIPLAGGKRAC